MKITDFHNHLIPGVDDGAQTLEESRVALRAMSEESVGDVVTTPHLDGSLTTRPEALSERLDELDAGWRRLDGLAREEFPDVRVARGVEVKLDTPEPVLEDERLRLAGTRFVLVEFPHLMLPPGSERALFHLSANGWTPVVAHPERYAGIEEDIETVAQWRRVGAHLQVNGGSLLGRYGGRARRLAVEFLERGWVDYLSSDFHARGQPGIQESRSALHERGGEEQAELLMRTNPTRLLNDEAPIPVPPIPKERGVLARFLARFQ